MRESAEALGKLRGTSGFQEEFQEACSAASLLNEQHGPLGVLRRPEVIKELHVGMVHRGCSVVIKETSTVAFTRQIFCGDGLLGLMNTLLGK